MPERTVTVGSASGLHARPAKLFVAGGGQAAGEGDITRRRAAGRRAQHARACCPSASTRRHEVTLEADGEGADAVLDTLADLLASDLDADEAAGIDA